MDKLRVIVDAMGGDYAPEEIVKGCIEAVNLKTGFDIELIGIEDEIRKVLKRQDYPNDRIFVTHAPQVITNKDKPTEAIKHKKDSSMVIGLKKIKENKGHVFISAGSTGALLAGTLLIAGRIPGIVRPALAPVVPSLSGGAMIIDAGMNTNCRLINYVQFAVMGSIYMQQMYNIKNPRVGLVNVGAEEEKGNKVLKEAFSLLNKCDINFVGNIEGHDIAEGVVDVAVCDGFTGNAMLKMMEGTGKYLFHHIKRIYNSNLLSKLSALLVRAHLKKLKDSVDPEIAGGTPILGVSGLVYKCHGNSRSNAIRNTILNACNLTKSVFIGKIQEKFSAMEVKIDA